MLKPFLISFILLLLSNATLFAQREITTFGLQFKPIISSSIVNTGPQYQKVGEIGFEIAPKGGFNLGMVVRKGFNEQFSLETGINISKRKYNLQITEDSTGFVGNSNFKYIIYEIPILGLVYVQLGEDFFMNAAFGAAINFLPSDWDTFDDYFLHYSKRESWIVPSLLANLGFEYRTKKSGFFYFGFSFHRPFTKITTAGVGYTEKVHPRSVKEKAFFDISGNYLTIDLRYFFHESPQIKKKKKR